MSLFSPALRRTLQLAGLLPLTTTNLSLGGEVLRSSWAWRCHTILVVLICCSCFLLWFHDYLVFVSRKRSDWSTTTSIVTVMCAASGSLLATTTSLATAFFRVQKKIGIFEQLRQIDFIIQNNDVLPITNIASLVAMMSFTFMFLYEMSEKWKVVPYYVALQVLKLVVMCSLVEFMELVLSVKNRFQVVNDRLAEVVARSRSNQRIWFIPLPAVETFTMPQEKDMRVHTLNQAHWLLCQLVHEISTIYGSQLLSLMYCILFQLITSPYYVFLSSTMSKRLGVPLDFTYIYWTLLFSGCLGMLVVPCTLTLNEAKKTFPVVTKQMSYEVDSNTYKELSTFASQLVYRQIQFSAKGVFTLQTSTIVSVGSAVFTYMAIIMQFQTSVGKT